MGVDPEKKEGYKLSIKKKIKLKNLKAKVRIREDYG